MQPRAMSSPGWPSRFFYFVFAKFELRLASINPSASPIWPPTGLAFVANLTTAGTLATAAAIAGILRRSG